MRVRKCTCLELSPKASTFTASRVSDVPAESSHSHIRPTDVIPAFNASGLFTELPDTKHLMYRWTYHVSPGPNRVVGATPLSAWIVLKAKPTACREVVHRHMCSQPILGTEGHHVVLHPVQDLVPL